MVPRAERRTNPTRAAKRKADPMAGSSSSNPKAKKARKVVARQEVPKKIIFSRLPKRQYESLRWDQNQYEFEKETDCGQMFRTVIQQKIYEEVILALDTKIARSEERRVGKECRL